MKAANKGAKACAAGGKGLNQGEFARPKHVPDAGSGERVTGGRADTASCHEKARRTALVHYDGRAAVRLLRLEEAASAGVDGLVWTGYEDGLQERLLDLTDAYTRERIGRCRRGGLKYPNRTAGRDRSALPPWKTRLSKRR